MIPGHATIEGTRRYARRFAAAAAGYFRDLNGWAVSSLGLGTYLGGDDEATDIQYRQAIARALGRAVNVLDTAVNYRHQRSERAVGAALAEAVGRGEVARDEVIVATKGGYIPLDAESGLDPRQYVAETYLRPGIIRPADVVGGAHCMAPRFLADQIERSRKNLGLETIDVYYVHNPESQLREVDRAVFLARCREAFAALEEAAAAGRIACYGTATWSGYREMPDAPDYLSLAEMVGAARDVGGGDHHFRVVQLPYNLGMTEAFTRVNQRVGDQMVTLVEAARRLGVYVMASASVHQGQLTRGLPPVLAEYIPGLATDAQRALQFVRSTPGVGTALVGMKSLAHVDENAAVAGVAPMAPEQFQRLFTQA